jgi:signal transduction histidine kinase
VTTNAESEKPSILLVDDEEGIRNVLKISLGDLGYEVQTAESGEAALELFRQRHHPIVMTDIKMPGIDGIEVLSRIKKIDPETEVIMITGHGDIDLAIKSLKLEATDFVTKPINDAALEISIQRAEERIAMRQQLKRYTENLEQLVEEKTRRLIDAERLSAIGQTIAGLSHSIKNIAGGLKGGMFVLEKGIELDNRDYLHQGWTMVRGNVDKITQLSLSLLDYAKPGRIRYQMCDPALPAREVVELMESNAEDNRISVDLAASPNLSPLYIDPEAIHRCLMNLVTNAVDACIEDDAKGWDRQIRIEVNRLGEWGVEYRVIDNCQGMDEEVRENIFNRFFSTKGSKGTGIGLMLTKKIVDDLKGYIEVETEHGVGSTFVMRVPKGEKTWRRRFGSGGGEEENGS